MSQVARIGLLTGPVGVGKTTVAERIVGMAQQQGLTCGGLLAPTMMNSCGQKAGIWGVDLLGGERRILARTDRELGGPTVGPYSFDAETLAWTVDVVENAISACDLLIVDEIGKLELWHNVGLASILPRLAESETNRSLILVRDFLLDELQARLDPAAQIVFEVNEENREDMPAHILQGLISKTYQEEKMANVNIGSAALSFELPAVDGKTYTLEALSAGKKATAVVFMCNHCPYVLAWLDRIITIAQDYGNRGVAFAGINANDPAKYAADDFEGMKKLAQEHNLSFPYLHDETQKVAHAYGAERTPEIFLFDADLKLRYHGAPDDNYEEAQASVPYLRNALDALLTNQAPPVTQTPPVGCTIKWK